MLFFRRRATGVVGAAGDDAGLVAITFVAIAFVRPGFVAAAFAPFAPFISAPFAFARARFGEEPSVESAAARRDAFRAGRAAGTLSAGRSARVRGATMVRKV